MAKKTTPLRAIRAKCLDCSCGQIKEVRECPRTICELYPYRLGHDPARRGIGASREHLAAIRPEKTVAEQGILTGKGKQGVGP